MTLEVLTLEARGPDIGGFLATLEALSKKDIGGLVTLEAC